MVLVKFSSFTFYFAVQIQHGPVALDKPPSTSNIYSIPSISVPEKILRIENGRIFYEIPALFNLAKNGGGDEILNTYTNV